jgi:hypothetical protein
MTEILKKDILLNTFILIDEINDNLIIDSLLKDVYENNNYYHKYTNVIAKHTEFKFLVGNKNFHNFLKSIKKQISSINDKNFIIGEAWANIYNKNDYAKKHKHVASTAFSGILFLTDGPGPGTYFNDYDLTVHEKKGRFVLFHGHLTHEVKKFNYIKDRITIAFNFYEEGFEEKNQKITYIK